MKNKVSPAKQLDLEKKILGAILIDPVIIKDVLEFVGPADFKYPLHRRLFTDMLNSSTIHGVGMGSISVSLLDNLFGYDNEIKCYLLKLIEEIPTSAYAGVHARQLHNSDCKAFDI